MAKKFVSTDAQRRLIDKVIQQGDMARRKRAIEGQARGVATTRQRRQARREAAAKAAREKSPLRDPVRTLPNAERLKQPLAGWKMLLVRMAPETWYLFSELREIMPEYARGSVKAWAMQKLLVDGLIERAGNPDHDPADYQSAMRDGRYLYALSASGVEKREEFRAQIGALCSK